MTYLYLTVPFVLSWSLIEAMAAGCCIVAGNTPVREVLTDGETGVLVDFFSPEQQADTIETLFTSSERRRTLANATPGQPCLRLREGLACLDGAHVGKQ